MMKGRSGNWWDGPLPWLAYLPFFVLPWFWMPPSRLDLALGVIGIAIFLPAYLLGSRCRGMRLIAAAMVVLGVGILLAPTRGAWTVFPIYAAAMLGQHKPARHAMIGIVAVLIATVATGLLLKQTILFWLPGAFLTLLTGGATVSREAFYDRTVALLATQEEVRRLAGTAERERITRDLHDVVGRTLTLVALKADLAAKLVARDAAAAEAEMRAVGDAARAGLAEVRAALQGQAGGSLAQEAKASSVALEAAGIGIRLEGDPAEVPPDAGAVLAMTLREAVTNVIRHAGATLCSIEIAATANGAQLSVSDDGRGGSFREGNGLTGMRQRLAAAGGTLAVQSGPGGTRIVADLPA
jgi:two-component system sensor histidine kinase DesK